MLFPRINSSKIYIPENFIFRKHICQKWIAKIIEASKNTTEKSPKYSESQIFQKIKYIKNICILIPKINSSKILFPKKVVFHKLMFKKNARLKKFSAEYKFKVFKIFQSQENICWLIPQIYIYNTIRLLWTWSQPLNIGC